MQKFSVDVLKGKVIKVYLGFRMVRKGNHIALARWNPDGTKTPMTIPNHRTIVSSTLRTILSQAGISREDFIRIYEEIQINCRPE